MIQLLILASKPSEKHFAVTYIMFITVNHSDVLPFRGSTGRSSFASKRWVAPPQWPRRKVGGHERETNGRSSTYPLSTEKKKTVKIYKMETECYLSNQKNVEGESSTRKEITLHSQGCTHPERSALIRTDKQQRSALSSELEEYIPVGLSLIECKNM